MLTLRYAEGRVVEKTKPPSADATRQASAIAASWEMPGCAWVHADDAGVAFCSPGSTSVALFPPALDQPPQFATAEATITALLLAEDLRVLVAGDANGFVYGFSWPNGCQLWKVQACVPCDDSPQGAKTSPPRRSSPPMTNPGYGGCGGGGVLALATLPLSTTQSSVVDGSSAWRGFVLFSHMVSYFSADSGHVISHLVLFQSGCSLAAGPRGCVVGTLSNGGYVLRVDGSTTHVRLDGDTTAICGVAAADDDVDKGAEGYALLTRSGMLGVCDGSGALVVRQAHVGGAICLNGCGRFVVTVGAVDERVCVRTFNGEIVALLPAGNVLYARLHRNPSSAAAAPLVSVCARDGCIAVYSVEGALIRVCREASSITSLSAVAVMSPRQASSSAAVSVFLALPDGICRVWMAKSGRANAVCTSPTTVTHSAAQQQERFCSTPRASSFSCRRPASPRRSSSSTSPPSPSQFGSPAIAKKGEVVASSGPKKTARCRVTRQVNGNHVTVVVEGEDRRRNNSPPSTAVGVETASNPAVTASGSPELRRRVNGTKNVSNSRRRSPETAPVVEFVDENPLGGTASAQCTHNASEWLESPLLSPFTRGISTFLVLDGPSPSSRPPPRRRFQMTHSEILRILRRAVAALQLPQQQQQLDGESEHDAVTLLHACVALFRRADPRFLSLIYRVMMHRFFLESSSSSNGGGSDDAVEVSRFLSQSSPSSSSSTESRVVQQLLDATDQLVRRCRRQEVTSSLTTRRSLEGVGPVFRWSPRAVCAPAMGTKIVFPTVVFGRTDLRSALEALRCEDALCRGTLVVIVQSRSCVLVQDDAKEREDRGGDEGDVVMWAPWTCFQVVPAHPLVVLRIADALEHHPSSPSSLSVWYVVECDNNMDAGVEAEEDAGTVFL